MNLREIAALMRRHIIAVMVILVLAASVGYMLKRTKPVYEETGTVVLAIPSSAQNPNPYNFFGDSLTYTGYVIVHMLMSPQGQQQLRAAGAIGTFNLALVNAYNEEYPNYEPYIAVTGGSRDPADAHRTFAIVAKVLSDDLSAMQAQQGVLPLDRISGTMVGDSGTIIQSGSPKREYGMLAALVIVVVFTVVLFLDRHPLRPRSRYLAWRYLRSHNPYPGADATDNIGSLDRPA